MSHPEYPTSSIASTLLTAVGLIAASIYLMRKPSEPNPVDAPSSDPDPAHKPSPTEIASRMSEIRVSKILVHPIKSCRGTSVSEARYTPKGLENDRKWCIVNAETYTIYTARDIPKMILIEPRLEYDSTSPYGGKLVVSVPLESGTTTFSVPINPTPEITENWPIIPSCRLFDTTVSGYIVRPLSPEDVNPDEVLSEYMGKPVSLVMIGPDPRHCDPTPNFPNLKATAVFQDNYPLLVASEESLQSVREAIGKSAVAGQDAPERVGGIDGERWKNEHGQFEMERFRPNIIFKGAQVPFAEEAIRTITINPDSGAGNISLVSPCARCLLPNVDPKSGVRDAAVPYKVIMKYRTGVDPVLPTKPCFGVNGVPDREGVVKVGDLVKVLEWATEN